MLLKELVAELRNLANEHQEISGFYTGLASEQNDSMIQYPALRVNFPYNALTSQDDDVISITFNLNLLVQSVAEVTGALSFEVETNYMNQQDTLNEIDQVLVDETELRENAIRIMATYIQGLRMLEENYPYFIVQDGWRIVGLDRYANDFVTGCSVELTISVANDYKCLSINNPDYSVWKENINFDSPILYKNIDCPTCPELSDYDFADPLVQAELTPQQDSDLTDYLIPLADFSDPAIQALLTPTQEADLETLLCTPSPTSPQYSMHFDGVNEYALIPNHAGINFNYTDNFSMTSWVNFADYSTPSFRWIFSKRDVNYRGYLIAFNGGNFYVYLATSVGALMLIRTNGVSFINNTWYNVGFTYNGSGLPSGVTIYVNGISVSTVLVSGGGINGTLNHTFPLYLSYDQLQPAFSNFKLGIIRFWRTLLSPTEMLQDYNGGTMLNNPIALSDMTFEFGAGRSALFGTQWVFPIGSENPTAYSINMEFADRLTDVPV